MSEKAIDMVRRMEDGQDNSDKLDDVSEFLEGFELVPSESAPSITLDNQLRIYLNSSTRRLLGIKPYDRLSIAYSPASSEIAIIKAEVTIGDTRKAAELLASNFVVDKRYYLHTKTLAEMYGFAAEMAPYHFDYSRGKSDGTIFAFRLRN